MRFLRFMSTPTGRTIRAVAGVAIIGTGLALGSPAGWALAAFGVLPLATGVANVCPICPLAGGSIRGCTETTCG